MENENAPDQEFWNLADEFIHLANKNAKQVGISKISAAILYAASRYNVFRVSANTKTLMEFEDDRESATKYFTEQYQKMFNDNFDEYLANYKKNV